MCSTVSLMVLYVDIGDWWQLTVSDTWWEHVGQASSQPLHLSTLWNNLSELLFIYSHPHWHRSSGWLAECQAGEAVYLRWLEINVHTFWHFKYQKDNRIVGEGAVGGLRKNKIQFIQKAFLGFGGHFSSKTTMLCTMKFLVCLLAGFTLFMKRTWLCGCIGAGGGCRLSQLP